MNRDDVEPAGNEDTHQTKDNVDCRGLSKLWHLPPFFSFCIVIIPSCKIHQKLVPGSESWAASTFEGYHGKVPPSLLQEREGLNPDLE